MKTQKITTLLMILLFVLGCTTGKNGPISLDHAECLFEYAFRESSDLPRERNEIRFDDCKEQWEWVIDEGWNICNENGFAYRIEYNEGNQYVINSVYNSTGSGTFTHLFMIEVKDDGIALVRSIAGGDRCQHGLYDVVIRDNYLHYSELITPFHLMSWGGRNLPFNAYDDCMVCCCGIANYKYDLKTNQREFVSVELVLDHVDGDDNFSKTYNAFIEGGMRILKEPDIKDFITKVEGLWPGGKDGIFSVDRYNVMTTSLTLGARMTSLKNPAGMTHL